MSRGSFARAFRPRDAGLHYARQIRLGKAPRLEQYASDANDKEIELLDAARELPSYLTETHSIYTTVFPFSREPRMME